MVPLFETTKREWVEKASGHLEQTQRIGEQESSDFKKIVFQSE